MTMLLACDLTAVEQCRQAVIAFLAEFGTSDRIRNRIEVVLEELVSNIIRHGQRVTTIVVTTSYCPQTIRFVIEDDGAAFNPLVRAAPEPFGQLAHAQLGGLGIAMVKKFAASLRYDPIGPHGQPGNRLTVEVAADPAHPVTDH